MTTSDFKTQTEALVEAMLKFVSMENGEVCASTAGTLWMQKWLAPS